jgi:hypothetical protein
MMMERISFVGDVIILVNFAEEKPSLIVNSVILTETDYLQVNSLNLILNKFL